MSTIKSTKRPLVLVFALVLAIFAFSASQAIAASPWWLVQSNSSPTYLPPGGTGKIVVTVENLGDAIVNGAASPVTITDRLPAGVVATAVSGSAGSGQIEQGFRGPDTCVPVSESSEVSCTWEEAENLQPYESMHVVIAVKAAVGGGGESVVSVSGGNAPGVTVQRPVAVSGAPTPFGLESFEMAAEEEGGVGGGGLDTQAGSHPFQLTSALTLNQTAAPLQPPAQLKDLAVALPAGLVGNATSFPQCSEAQFSTVFGENINECLDNTVVGVASVTLAVNVNVSGHPLRETFVRPLFNLAPGVETPARFGFEVEKVPVTLDASVRTGGDYGVTVSSENTSELASLQAVDVTFWGVPGDARHDNARGWNCLEDNFAIHYGGSCALGETQPPPLLTLPTSCTGPLQSSVLLTSWPTRETPGGLTNEPFPSAEAMPGLTGCEQLPFTPTLNVTPETQTPATRATPAQSAPTQTANTPTGLGADIQIPSIESPESLSEANLQRAAVTLPEGVTVNPAAANGLGACTPEEIGLHNANPAACPESSKLGTAEAISPDLKTPLAGNVYVAQQNNNPFGSLLAVYLVVEGEGVLVKLAGEVHLDPTTGQITTTFDNVPQQDVTQIKLNLFSGTRAALITPPGCGTYTTTSQLTPYSSTLAAEPTSPFQITSCPARAFNPTFTAGTTATQAGAYSPFTLTFARQDSEQNLSSIEQTLPPGLLAKLAGVPRCGETQANEGACPQASQIGTVTVAAGVGSEPLYVSGTIYLTGPYNNGPFGIAVEVPAIAGPFDLDENGRPVVVRGSIRINPRTAQASVVSNAFPTILQGIPLNVKTVNVTLDRRGFTFNPTSCNAMALTGAISSTAGATAAVSNSFQAVNCASLPFKASFTASTAGRASKAGGASLTVKIASKGGPGTSGEEANIRSVKVDLPKQLPSRLTTLQKACTATQFEANPAGCPKESDVGTATANTPVLAVALTGPAYLVSHGGEAFPDLEILLQGEGVKLVLDGNTLIKKGITSSTFRTVPDAPISSFELKLPAGKYSILGANVPQKARYSLCGQALSMPTAITGQNGAVIKQSTHISVSGCAKAHQAKKSKKKGKKVKGKQR
jgi:hypothetical protein